MEWLYRIVNKSRPVRDYADLAICSWQTCAVGEARDKNLDALVPQVGFADEPPADARLKKLGVEFGKAVACGHRRKALRLYFAIQKRIAHLAGVRA